MRNAVGFTVLAVALSVGSAHADQQSRQAAPNGGVRPQDTSIANSRAMDTTGPMHMVPQGSVNNGFYGVMYRSAPVQPVVPQQAQNGGFKKPLDPFEGQ